MTPPSAEATLPARGAVFDQIGSELLSALDACRPQSLSLHDAAGDVLWLNTGFIGPDEHGYVLDALDELALEPKRTHMQRRLADNRRALFMGARDPSGNCCGLVFVILDTPGGPEDHQQLPQPLATLMVRLSMQLAPTAARLAALNDSRAGAAHVAVAVGAAVAEPEFALLELEPAQAPRAAIADQAPGATSSVRTTTVEFEITELELESEDLPTEPVGAAAALHAAPIEPVSAKPAAPALPIEPVIAKPVARPAPIAQASAKPAARRAAPEPVIAKTISKAPPAKLESAVSDANAVTTQAPTLTASISIPQAMDDSLPIRARKFVRLHGRGTNRRYEVAVLPGVEGQDIRIIKAVSAWLSHHLDQYTEEHASFAVPITSAAALDGRFVAALGGALGHRVLPEGMLGLLVPSSAWRHPGSAPLFAQCERLLCPVTLDDFSLRHDGFQILRSKAIRMVKLDPQITGAAMNDRFARAALAAITQSARVLGFHCIAKGDISSSGARWLGAAGIDYADPTTASAAGAQAPKGARLRSQGQST